jgi:hypothetical protein
MIRLQLFSDFLFVELWCQPESVELYVCLVDLSLS